MENGKLNQLNQQSKIFQTNGYFPFSINLMKICLLNNAAFSIGNGLHDDEGIRVKLLDGGFDAADFEARNDAV